ncbi:hypothetical protein ACFWMR_19425 [Amycolatopsis thailandensis]|uniref:hypothetical protein n=1 Tax=Amycolatopsis thailandensis TaxID=589330 RepID=UPI0036668853
MTLLDRTRSRAGEDRDTGARGRAPRHTGAGAATGAGQPRARRSRDRPADPATAPPIVDSVLRSDGQPLDDQSRSVMESRCGHDFGAVRLHTRCDVEQIAPGRPSPLPPTEAAFDAMVSSHYTFFREEFRNDVAFLRKVEDGRCSGTFDRTVYFLQAAKQHQPAPKSSMKVSSTASTTADSYPVSEAIALTSVSVASEMFVVRSFTASNISRATRTASGSGTEVES